MWFVQLYTTGRQFIQIIANVLLHDTLMCVVVVLWWCPYFNVSKRYYLYTVFLLPCILIELIIIFNFYLFHLFPIFSFIFFLVAMIFIVSLPLSFFLSTKLNGRACDSRVRLEITKATTKLIHFVFQRRKVIRKKKNNVAFESFIDSTIKFHLHWNSVYNQKLQPIKCTLNKL